MGLVKLIIVLAALISLRKYDLSHDAIITNIDMICFCILGAGFIAHSEG